MKLKSYKLDIVFFLIAIVSIIHSSTLVASTNFEYLDISKGLPQNTVQCIEKDNFGFIWFGTDNGFCRFDGYDFKYYQGDKNENASWDNRILKIMADSHNYLWIATKNGIHIFNILSAKFEVIDNPSIIDVFENEIIDVVQNEERVWIATRNSGIYELGVGKTISLFKVLNHYWTEADLPSPTCLINGSDGEMILGTEAGVYQLNHSQQAFQLISLPANIGNNIYVNTLYKNEEEIWIGSNNGVFVYLEQKKEIAWYAHNPSVQSTISHSYITSIEKDNEGNILVGTLGGLTVFNSETKSFNELVLFPLRESKSQVEFIRTIFVDNSGNVWIGTEKTGVVHYNTYKKQFHSFPESDSKFDAFNFNIINSIFYSNNVLWVGTAGDGVIMYNTSNDKLRHFKYNVDNPATIESNFITSIHEDKAGNMWFGTWGMGLQKRQKGKISEFTSYHTTKGMPDDFVSTLYYTEQGVLLIGTQGGLCVYDPEKDRIVPVELINKTGEEIWEVSCVIEDNEGYLWVGTTNGLHRLKSSHITSVGKMLLNRYDIVSFIENDEENCLPNNYVTALEKDAHGDVWVGTYGGGIAKAIPDVGGTFKFINYNEADGLASNVAYRILSDINNNLWISTENGLSQYLQDEDIFINHYEVDGLRNNQYYWAAAYKDDSGQLYFGGINGLNYFHPDSIKSYPFDSKVAITGFNIFNKAVTAGEERHGIKPLIKPVFTSDTIEISYKDNVFSFEFSALPYHLSKKVKYAYQLEGVDKDWVEVEADRRVASYTNLDGGTYEFRVKATNLDGQWNRKPTKVLLIIQPPYWKTLWFKYVLVIVIVLLIIAYINYRSYNLSTQKRRLEKIVEKRTVQIKIKNEQLEESGKTLLASNQQLASQQREVEEQKTKLETQNTEIISQRDQLIALNKEIESIHQMRMQFFTNISHEFRTPLTLIISPIEKMLSENFSFSRENVVNTAKYVKRNAQRLLMLTNEIMTFRKYEAGKVTVSLTQGDVGRFIVNIAETFKQWADQKNIVFHISVDFGLDNTWYDKAKLENILFNLLSNALKYTPVDGEVSVAVSRIQSSDRNSRLLINIKDSGMGIPLELQGKVFERFFRDTSNHDYSSIGTGIGLALTKQMVEVLNGTISVDSEVNRGSSFKVILPIEQTDFPSHEVEVGETLEQVSLKEKIDLLVYLSDSESGEVKPAKIVDDGSLKPNLLVVEDSKDLRDFLAQSFRNNYTVFTACDGEEGYKKALEKDFDIVVSDIMMPKVNGLEMCKQLKNNLHTSHVPIILLTAKGQEEDYVEGLEYGADDYIAKPFNFAILQAKINSLVENRKRLKKLFQDADTEFVHLEIATSSLDEDFMSKVNEVIESSYIDPTFDIDAFSSQLFVSRSLLYKKLKALTNLSPNEYMNIYRLKKSINLLKTGKLQVSEVAYQVGFNDPKYFSRVFKKFYNCSPSSFLE